MFRLQSQGLYILEVLGASEGLSAVLNPLINPLFLPILPVNTPSDGLSRDRHQKLCPVPVTELCLDIGGSTTRCGALIRPFW